MKKILACSLAIIVAAGLAFAVYRRFGGVVMVSWIDFVKWNGVPYEATEVSVPESLIGEKLGEVLYKMPHEFKGSRPPKTVDGDAAFLEAGTELFAIEGFSAENYIAAATQDGYVAYRDHDSENPKFTEEMTIDLNRIKYVRADGYHEGAKYPQVKYLTSADDMQKYIDENKEWYNLLYQGDPADKFSLFYGVVLENHGASVLVEPEEGSWIRSSADKISVSISGAALYDESGNKMTAERLAAGASVAVYFTGVIAESYPAQIRGQEIRLGDEAKERGKVNEWLRFGDATSEYGGDFFNNNILILVLLEEPSGSIRHTVTGVSKAGDTLTVHVTRHLPGMGTCDMAEWHIIIEAPRTFYSAESNVVLTEERAQPSTGLALE
ncbi:MAG: hypothetical protein FWF05_09045 [Oscillospiraceae bacterium]|nr:hypothetical protein [Oscillospiraceae bacterium]